MEHPLITVNLPTQSVTFRPGGSPASFEVNVRNDSDRQAQFQLDVLAAGADPNFSSDWYRLSPEVSVAKPPGDTTNFQIFVLDTPIPDFIGNVNLTIKVFSPQLPGEVRRIVRLTIEPGLVGAPLSIRLLAESVQVYPRNTVDIAVQIRNQTHHSIEAFLNLSGLAKSWLPNGTERRIQMAPKAVTDVTFQCQPPSVMQCPSQAYSFSIEATEQGGFAIRANGILEVLPVGFIKFSVNPPHQSIPAAKGWLPDWKTRSALYQATFENVSNLVQRINLELQGRDRQHCIYNYPTDAGLGLAETTTIPFEVTTKRPWVGLAKTLKLDAIAQPKALNSVDIEPATQAIELRVLPIVPLWLVLALLALLAALLALLLQPNPIGHTDFVNAVRFSSDALSAVSGSDDCTIRRWTINGDRLQPEDIATNVPTTTCNDEPLQPEGVLAFTDQTVFSLEFLPRNNDQVAAGLANGAIQIWNLPTRTRTTELRDPNDTTEDRVFDLAFTEDARTLFSGHGSGQIRVWQRPSGGSFGTRPTNVLMLQANRQQQVKYQVRALALNQDGSMMVSAGSKNTLALWNLANPDQPPQLLMPQESEEDYVWSVAFAPGTSLLATSDSKGFIALWNLEQCLAGASVPSLNNGFLNCSPYRRWQAVQANGSLAVRSLRFSLEGRQLVSGGDDGRVMLWTLANTATTSSLPPESKLLLTSSEKISTVDLVETAQDLLMLSGGDDRQVNLRRIRRERK